jgi:hypothetical protein
MAGVTIFPIVGWETKATPAGYGALTIAVCPVRLEADPERTLQAHHFGIAAEQCELLAQDLAQMATTLRELRKPLMSSNLEAQVRQGPSLPHRPDNER